MEKTIKNKDDLRVFFEKNGVSLTRQRLDLGYLLLKEKRHLNTSELIEMVNSSLPYVSRATIFNTINLFLRYGLMQKFDIQSGATIYDTNGTPHHHLYEESTGEIHDVFLEKEMEEKIRAQVKKALPLHLSSKTDMGRVLITLPV